ncbi:MAG: hypothetical protein QM638_08060 [Nocardioides sp.]|uniref:hypothetical protein n=1 Tax=Nocardioides sp. TaxID=35761 RepID=UPI0039E2B8C9
MLRWSGLDPQRFERAAQMLLRRLYPGLTSLDGAGGDGGADARLVTEDGLTVFECKYFHDRLNNSRRRQIESSLRTAVKNAPKMRKWVLVVPLNRTPSRTGSTSSEDAWFTGKLQACAPGVELQWWGQDWLDGQFAEHRDLRRYVEGEQAELLQLAGDYGHETAVLASGTQDLAERNRNLRRLIDEVSPHWTVDWRVEGDLTVNTLRAKTPDAAELDPVNLLTTFHFDAVGEPALRTRYEEVTRFGGAVTVPSGAVEIRLDASPEVRRLLSGIEGPGEVQIRSAVITLPRPIRGQVQILGEVGDQVIASVDVYLRQRMSGSDGVTLMGGDAAGALSVTVRLPRPRDLTAPQLLPGGGLTLEFAAFTDFDLAAVLPLLEFQAAATEGRQLRFRVPGLVSQGERIEDRPFGPIDSLVEAARALRRLEELLDRSLRLPQEFILRDLQMVQAAVASLEGEQGETPYDDFTANVMPGKQRKFVEQLTEDPFLLRFTNEDLVLRLGDLEIPYGLAMFYAPRVTLVNRDELLSGESVTTARFRSDGGPFRLLPRSMAAEVHAADVGKRLGT